MEEYDIFISHSSIDSTIAFMLCEAFETKGINCWIAPRNVKIGFPYADSIVEGIEKSQALVVLFSDNVNKSSGVLKELEIATNSKIPIIPLRIENIFPLKSMKFYIMSNHWIDAINPKSIKDFEDFVLNVKNTISPNKKDSSIDTFTSTHAIRKIDKSNTFYNFISALLIPFSISFILLIILSNIIYPHLELKNTIYSFFILSVIIAKISLIITRR